MPLLLDATGTDVLADVLDSLRLRGRLFCRCEFSAPWGLGIAEGDFSHFHIIERGNCWLQLQGEADAIELDEGDLLLVTRGRGYRLSDAPDTPPVPLADLVGGARGGPRVVLQHGGGGRAASLICGAFDFGGPFAKSFLAVFPEWIRVPKGERGGNEWLDAIMRFLAQETRQPEVGAGTIITSLIDVLFVEAVRTWLRKQPLGTAGWLGALRDPSIAAALSLIHQAPEKQWTVPALSASVGMSRSPFAARFTALVGQSPIAYLKRWRLQLGAALLRDESLALSRVAQRVGYESTAAFSRAFTREFGISPGTYRRGLGEVAMGASTQDRKRARVPTGARPGVAV
jgi:AraC-like DNA-binding protein